MCHVGVSNEGYSPSISIELSNDCKWVFHEASFTTWCQTVVHFEVKISHFIACDQDDRPKRSR